MIQLFNWFRRRSLERGFDRELQYHFDRRVADLIAAGIPDIEARRRVAVELGLAQVREEVRDVWLTRWFRDFLYDLRFSARSFVRSPGFTAATLLSLALGIGATTAVYSLVDQVILHSLPVRDPGRLVLVDWKGVEDITYSTGSMNLMPYPMCRDLQQQTRIFDGVLCRAEIQVILTAGGDPMPVAAEIVSGSYFSVLGIGPALGRVIEPEDDAAAGAGPVIVLSYDFWQAQFGGAADIVGRKVLIGNHPMTVAGVAAAGFRGVDVGAVPAFWMPTSMYADANVDDGSLNSPVRWLQILARLRPDVTLAQAQTGLQPWFKAWLQDSTLRPGFPRISADHRREYLATTLELTSAPQGHSPLRHNLSQPLWLLFAATGILLGLACLNVAGLFVARGSARGREIVTRLALGASRGRIGRQLLADSLLLAVAGGVLGAAVAPLAIRGLIAFLPHDLQGNALSRALSFHLLTFAFFASIAAGLLSGLAPALHAGRDALVSSLRERGGTGFGGVRLRKAIVTLQVAFSLILLVGAALFLRTLTGLLAKGPGFDTSSLLSFAIAPLQNGYSDADAARLVRRLDSQVRALPGVRSSGVARFAFLNGGAWGNVVTIQTDRRFVTDGLNFNAVSPGFFSTFGVHLLAGRDFNQSDSRPAGAAATGSGPRSAIVNQAFIKRYLNGRDPLGVLIARGGSSDVKPNGVIVGVVADMSYRGVRDHSEQVFFPLFERDYPDATFYIRVHGAPEQAIPSIRRLVNQDDPRLPILWFRTLDQQVNRSLSTERMLAALSGSFGALALLLSLIGLYGVMSFVVTRRTREIGIRLALGATGASAIRLVLRDAVVMIAAGIAIALPCVGALGKLVQSQLFGVTATDPATIAAAALVLAAGALTAAFIPAWRASNVSPTDALRLE